MRWMHITIWFGALAAMSACTPQKSADDPRLIKESREFVETAIRAISNKWDPNEVWSRADPELHDVESPDDVKKIELLPVRMTLA